MHDLTSLPALLACTVNWSFTRTTRFRSGRLFSIATLSRPVLRAPEIAVRVYILEAWDRDGRSPIPGKRASSHLCHSTSCDRRCGTVQKR